MSMKTQKISPIAIVNQLNLKTMGASREAIQMSIIQPLDIPLQLEILTNKQALGNQDHPKNIKLDPSSRQTFKIYSNKFMKY